MATKWRNLVRTFWIWRARKHYEKFDKIDLRLGVPIETSDLRAKIASDIITRINAGFIERGVPKSERKIFMRKIVKGLE